MNPASFARVLDLFAQARELPPGERAAFLAQACPEDEAVRQEVVSLLQAHGAAPDFLAAPAFGEGMELLHAATVGGELQPGEELGDCRVLCLLGEGGMGEVYLAEDTRLERRVAVKLLKRRLDDGSLARRFRHEKKVLAALTHPNIARLYGGGVTPEGRSYLVMEYVEGERLDQFCQARSLNIAERLALFRKVCAAVAYAHQNLVVHRDLKPANIRVTVEGEPKLLDFGIAKLLDPEGTTAHADPTLTMQGAMTPEYASPEQLKGAPITTASDVYSLGVVLYELLTGQRPFAHLKGRRLDELARAVCEDEPPRASSSVARQTTPAKATIPLPATQPSTTMRQHGATLRRQLEGDLDNIVAKALRKEPSRRYPSVLALSEDLRRYGEGLPVSARKDTLPYRAGKFVRRNKTMVTAVTLILLALVAGLIVATWQAEIARRERDRARLAQKQAEQLNGFLQTLLSSADPENGPGRDLKVVQVLDQASNNLDRELAGDPVLLAQAHETVGQAYARLEVVEPALEHLRIAVETDRRLYGEENIVTARAKAALGATLHSLTRRYAEAEPLLRQALVVERRQPASEQTKLPFILDYEARALSQLGQVGEAKTLVTEYLALTRRADGEQNLAYTNGLLQLANLSIAQQDDAGAEMPCRQAVTLLRQLRPQTPSLASTLTTLAYVLMLEGKLDEPEGLLQEAREIYRRTVGEQGIPPALTLGCLAWLHFLHGEYPLAKEEFRTSQAIGHAAGVPDDEQDYVGGKVCLAVAMTRTGEAVAAEPILRENLGYAQAKGLEGNAAVDYVTASLGECLFAQKRYPEAEECLRRGYDLLRQNRGEQAPKTVEAVHLLHDLYLAWNKPSEAARYQAGATIP